MKKNMVLMLVISLLVNAVGAEVSSSDATAMQSNNLPAVQSAQINSGQITANQPVGRDLNLQQYAQQQRTDFAAPADLSSQAVGAQASQPAVESAMPDASSADVQVKRVVPAIVKPVAKKAQKASVDQSEAEKVG